MLSLASIRQLAILIRSSAAGLFGTLLLSASCLAAIPADTVWELRSGGSDTLCGGGFSAANKGATGTDWTQQNGAKYTYTADLSASGTTTLTSAGSNFTNDILGNVIRITGQGDYCVTAFTSTAAVTVDRSLGTFSGATGYLGGGRASFSNVNSVAVAGNLVYVYAGGGAYTISSNISNDAAVTWIGYNTTRTAFNTDATLPTINCGANSITMLSVHAGAAGNEVRNLAFNANSQTGATAVDLAHFQANARRCTATGFATGFHTSWNLNHFEDCYTSGCTTGFGTASNSLVTLTGCVASGGSTGFNTSTSQVVLTDCIATGCSGVGFSIGNAGSIVTNCSAYGCGGDQFSLNANNIVARNCIAYGGSAKQFNAVTTANHCYLINCAADAGGTGQTANFNAWEISGLITLTANPYTNTGSGNYALNSTAGGGTLCKGAAAPSAFTGISTTNGLDIGAVQTANTGGGPTYFAR
jgi:hypothetical protein